MPENGISESLMCNGRGFCPANQNTLLVEPWMAFGNCSRKGLRVIFGG